MNDDAEIRGRAFALMRRHKGLSPDLARRAAVDELARERLKAIWNNPGTPEHGYLTEKHMRPPTKLERRAMSIGREVEPPLTRDPARAYGDVRQQNERVETDWGTRLPRHQAEPESRRQQRVADVASKHPMLWSTLNPQDADDLIRSAANSATLGAADWVAGTLGPRSIREEQATSRNREAASPIASGAGMLAGTLLPYSLPGKMLMAGKIPQAFGTGAAMGSVHGGLTSGTTPKEIGRGAAYALPDSLFNGAPLLPGLIPLAGAGMEAITDYDPYHKGVMALRKILGIPLDWAPPMTLPGPQEPPPVTRRDFR